MNHIAAIHTIKSKLIARGVMSDDDYRALLKGSYGGALSCKQLAPDQLRKLRGHFDGLARTYQLPKAPQAQARKVQGRPAISADRAPLVRRIRAQLIALGRLPDSYADGIARQMWGAQAPNFYEWCSVDQLRAITTALALQQQRPAK